MSSSGRRTSPLAWAVPILIAAAVLGTAWVYSSWRERRFAALEAGSALALLPQGVMEFAERGDGPVVLVIHGSPGGYDQGLVYGEELLRRGFRVLSVSRPGYLRTPLETGASFGEQADAIAELLSQRRILSCAVLGVSEGSPCALELASRHPKAVSSLVLLSPPGESLGRKPIESIGYQTFHDLTGDLGCWLLALRASWKQQPLFSQMMGVGSTLRPSRREALATAAMADPRQCAFLRGLALSVTPLTPREHGIINDNAQLRDLPRPPELKVSRPVMVLAGEGSSATPLVSVEKFFSAIPGARVAVVPDVGHILPVGRNFERSWDMIASFLKSPSGPGALP